MQDRGAYLSVLNHDASVAAQQVASIGHTLEAQTFLLDRLWQQQSGAIVRLAAGRRVVGAALESERSSLRKLARRRRAAAALVNRYRDQRTAAQIEAAGQSMAGSALVDNGRWAWLFLYRLEVPRCHSNLVTVVAWEVTEGNGSSWNPLATTYPMPGATDANKPGVKNYVSLDQGILATILTLRQPGLGNEATRGSLAACLPPRTTAEAIRASAWCTGCSHGAYVTGVIPAVEAHFRLFAGQ
jgi:hypothetical protein